MIGRKHDASRPAPRPRRRPPRGRAVGRHGDPPRGRLVQGEPRRHGGRGDGATGGLLDDRAVQDVAAAAALLPAGVPVALRGSSMGGYLALIAAERAGAAAVVAVCPAPSPLLARGLRTGRLEVAADTAALEALLAAHPLEATVAALDVPVLVQHAEGDEQVPVAGSRALAPLLRHPASRVDVMPGGDHRSVQHDPAAQAAALAWLREVMAT